MVAFDPSRLGVNFTSQTHSDTYAQIDPSGITPAPCIGRTVLVTGAAKGIGRAIVASYAKAGANRIAITARGDVSATHAEALQAAAKAGRDNVEFLILRLDVNNHDTIEACAQELASRWGHIDILVNNAGYLAPFVPLGEGDKDDWWLTWEVNVRGVYWVIRALLPLILKSKDKTIVNLTSVGALALTPGASAYQPSKLAVLRLSEYLMVDYESRGLLVYSVHPASAATDLANNMPAEIVQAVCHDTPELAGDSIVFLTSERREWLAGRYISCAWDMPELMARRKEIVEKDLLKLQVRFQ
ncbi:putative secondary metabolism biosynthetic enzyme [Podospora pseudocomata]|uniref:Secondary metabolism biosynthetic enzyme n=1 Tax=Podospora pseudocomata TaxID=2093779 RepID=A0ABR0GDT4_9PEZI|nr:putative secondary metabolism biosynthetic enzyme [Podospora pseudocomata]